MSRSVLPLVAPRAPAPAPDPAVSPGPRLRGPDRRARSAGLLAEILLRQGAIGPGDLTKALALQRHQDLPIGEILIAQAMISEAQLLSALSEQTGADLADLAGCRPDPGLAAALDAKSAIALTAVPWRRAGRALVVATNRPQDGDRIRAACTWPGPVLIALAAKAPLQKAVTDLYGNDLARLAESRAPRDVSCRDWRGRRLFRALIAGLAALLAAAVFAPGLTMAGLLALSAIVLLVNTGLKALAIWSDLRQPKPPARSDPDHPDNRPVPLRRLPVVTVLVPLLRERDIAGQLVARIARIDYPRELLDVILVIEAGDPTTLAALQAADLPPWMRAVVVPPGSPQTKPRALNYALNFARGSVVGVYDAEDAPEPDQIRKVARRFAEAPAKVACLQGQLDFYNPRHNWLSRCFTLEYAMWFRLMLPSVARLGLVVPLGGTTLFFRRAALERLGAWDAHNVTEDADLGLRLARQGYRTEMIETTTFEEANAALLPWIRQRSRWLKGYALTWAVHMRDPVRLWRDLGPRRFWGMQVQFLGAVVGFALAPVTWSFALPALGRPYPLDPWVGPGGYLAIGLVFLSCEALSLALALRASRLDRHRSLRGWALTLQPYFLLATFAMLIALWEMARRPFHWAKTAHGAFSRTAALPGAGAGTGAQAPLTLPPPPP